MKIVFDGFWWAAGPTANRMVMREVIRSWRAEFPDDEMIVAVRRGAETSDMPHGVRVVRTRLWPQLLSNGVELPLLRRRLHADLMLVHNYAPWWGASLVFVHDLMFVDHPEWFSRAERAYFAAMPRLLRRAGGIATSTRTEARRIARLTVDGTTITTVGLAVPTDLTSSRPTQPRGAPDTSFSLVVGRLNVRKNLRNAILGASMASSVSMTNPLLVVGSSEYSGKSLGMPEEVRRLVESGEVRFLGSVTDGELRWLYERAALVMCLSRDEGFGLPPVEAAHFGARLLVSDISVFHETVGGYAEFVDPDNVDEIATMVDSLAAAGHSDPRPDPYSWRKTAQLLRQSAECLTMNGAS